MLVVCNFRQRNLILIMGYGNVIRRKTDGVWIAIVLGSVSCMRKDNPNMVLLAIKSEIAKE